MLHYLKMLDPINAKILEGLGRLGPRNKSLLARFLKLPATTVAFRIKKLTKKGNLAVRANLNHSRLGLKRAVLIADVTGGLEEKLRETVENIDYWTYVTKCYGRFNGTYALFAFPAEHKDKMEAYLKEAVRREAMSQQVFFWLTDLCEVAPNFDWFDFDGKAWKFQWRQWIGEVLKASATLSERLVKPEKYRIMVDETDLFLLKELEKDASVEFSKVADALEMSPQGVRYRYYKHIMKHELISDYAVTVFPYPPFISEMCSFFVHFQDEEALAKFSNTLSSKPFIINYGKIIGRNSLLIHSYTPKTELTNFINVLNKMIKRELITEFFYVNLDIPSYKLQTVSYEFFRDNSWIFNYKEKLKRLKEVMRN